MIKLYRVEQAQEVYAVIDHSRLSAREGILDGYVDAALHLALVAERSGDKFGLVTFSADHARRVVLRASSGLDHFRRCRETIYNLTSQRVSPDFREVFWPDLQTTCGCALPLLVVHLARRRAAGRDSLRSAMCRCSRAKTRGHLLNVTQIYPE